MNTETLEKPQTAIAEYSPTAAALAELRQRHGNVAFEVVTGKGMDVAKKARAEIRDVRVALEKRRVELKAPALERSRLIDAEAKSLTAQLLELETPIDQQIKAEEQRKEAEKEARLRAEQERMSAILARVDAIRAFAVIPAGTKAAVIRASMDKLEALEVTTENYGERTEFAKQAKDEVLTQMDGMHDGALEFEAEQARMVAEREELARLKAEQDTRDAAERARVAAEQKAAADRLAAERAAFQREQDEARALARKQEEADRARRDEEDRKAREARAAEDKRVADARAALEVEQRAVREAEEARATESRRVEREAADAAAALERKRLDDEAAAHRAEQARIAAEERAAEDRADRVRAAAPALLGACQVVAATPRIPKEVMAVVRDAIAAATGEEA